VDPLPGVSAPPPGADAEGAVERRGGDPPLGAGEGEGAAVGHRRRGREPPPSAGAEGGSCRAQGRASAAERRGGGLCQAQGREKRVVGEGRRRWKKKKMRERRVSDTWVPHVGSWDEEEI
jgi:hypothetical protein